MEKVIFILFLALSMCLGEQEAGVTLPVASSVTTAANSKASGLPTTPQVPPVPNDKLNNETAANAPSAPPNSTDTSNATKPNTTDNASKPSSSTEASTPKVTSQSPKDDKNSTAHDTTTPKSNNDTLPNGDKVQPKNDTVPASTKAPPSHDETIVVQTRAFDGPSFIGGIILTLGILAIGFMGFKYYRNQTERNYHTL